MMIFARIAQFVIVAIPVVLFGWLVQQELVPSGTFSVSRAAGETSPYIDRILPDNRVEEVRVDEDGDTVRPVFGDPAFFFVHPHRGFETVDARLWFKNEGVPIVELGGLVQPDGEIYDLKPIQNTIIDNLDWNRIRSGEAVLLQRNPTYQSIGEFLENPPPRHEIATYHFNLSKPYRIPGYQPMSGTREINASLRGFHTFKTYTKGEPLDFTFSYMDMNRDPGPDPVEIVAIDERGRHVKTVTAEDDGERGDDAFASDLREVRLLAQGIPEGVYKIELRINKDIFIRNIRTRQHKIVFMNNVYLGDQVGYRETPDPVRFWTEAKSLAFQTHHAESVQDIQVGEETVALDAPYKRVEHNVETPGVSRVLLPKGDTIVHTDGHIAFSPDQFFNPDPIRLRYNTNLDALDVNYVIANYTPPREEGDWLVGETQFNARILALQEETWKFAISSPGIENVDGLLNVGKVEMDWHRKPLATDEIWSEFNAFFRR